MIGTSTLSSPSLARSAPRGRRPGPRRLALLLAALALAACAKTQPTLSGIGEPCLANADCATGFVCTSSKCALPANLGGCQPAALRCNGSDVEVCTADGLGWERSQTCATGCSGGACRPQICTPGAQRCEGDSAEECSPAGDVWALVQVCPTHCDATTGRCKAPACAPFSARCDPSGANNVEVCDAFGGGYVVTACSADEKCVDGICVTGSANCQQGDLRCNGPDVQQCDPVSAGVTRWDTKATCLGGCTSGGCNPGGSCTGVSLHAAVSSVPADGVSQVLVFSDPITGLDGSLLPDGQEFTVSALATGANRPGVVSQDADAALAGVQVRSVAGRIHFVAQAPVGGSDDVAGTLAAVLVAGQSCSGSAPVTFAAPSSATGVLVAEDFTGSLARDASGTTADWNTLRGALVATSPIDPGTGSDGDLSVAVNSSFDLSHDSSLMPAYAVTQISGAQVTVGGVASGLSGGDEVILWDVQGSAAGFSNAGTYETHRIASVAGGVVQLDGPVRGFFGAVVDEDVTAQRVVLQRVPQLASLSVAPGGALTAQGWNGSSGGLLFVRVHGAASIQGEVQMIGRGFRGSVAPATLGEDFSGLPSTAGALAGAGGVSSGAGYGTAGAGNAGGKAYGDRLLAHLHLGAGGGFGPGGAAFGGAGGGAIWIAASSLSLASDTGAWEGRVHADGAASPGSGGGGAGGSVWLQATTLALGTLPGAGLVGASGAGTGGLAGGAGRIRIDYLATDTDGVGGPSCVRAQLTPACALGAAGPLSAQSTTVFDAGGTRVIREATLLAAVAAGAGPLPGAVYRASAIGTDAPDFSPPLDLGSPLQFVSAPASPQLGNRFRWRVELTPAGAPQLLLGLQWALKVN